MLTEAEGGVEIRDSNPPLWAGDFRATQIAGKCGETLERRQNAGKGVGGIRKGREILCMKYIYGGKEVFALPGGGADQDSPSRRRS